MHDLATFQSDFARAILANDQPDRRFRSLAFSVYRNTTARGVVEALRASFPTVDALLGSEAFTEISLHYRRKAPPTSPALSDYGADFPQFLRGHPWSSELPYLADVARLDRLWLECFLAGTADSQLSSIEDDARIKLHPAARFVWLPTPALTIWQAHRDASDFEELMPEWREEGALFVRPSLQVSAQSIDRACHHLLYLLSAGTNSPRVDECVTVMAPAYPEANIPELLQHCVAAGALILQ